MGAPFPMNRGLATRSLIFLLCVLAQGVARAAESAAQLAAADRVLVIAHRGNSSQAPENTLVAFRSAVDAGADLVELDYHHSSDNAPVVLHDEALDRTTDAVAVFGRRDIPVASKSLATLKCLDAGSWFGPRFRGERLATLSEALDVIQQGAVTLVERKAGDAATCIAILENKELVNDVVVQSFDWGFLERCHRLAPQLVLAALGSKELDGGTLGQIRSTGADVLGWHHKHLGPAQIELAHRHRLKVWVYTVNDPGRASELMDAGVDGIITDAPGLMRNVADRRAQDVDTGQP